MHAESDTTNSERWQCCAHVFLVRLLITRQGACMSEKERDRGRTCMSVCCLLTTYTKPASSTQSFADLPDLMVHTRSL